MGFANSPASMLTRSVQNGYQILQTQGARALVDHTRQWVLRNIHSVLWDDSFRRFEQVSTSGRVPPTELMSLDPADPAQTKRACEYLPSPRLVVHWLIDALPIDLSRFHFVDFGSGRGRVLMAAAERLFRSVRGVELCEQLHLEAERNLASYPTSRMRCTDVASVCCDATRYELPDGDCVAYFFNPFDGTVLSQTVERTLSTARRNDRQLYFIYFNPDHAGRLTAHPEISEVPQSRWLRARMALFSPYKVRIFKRSG